MITALGNDRESTWQAIKSGRCGIKPIEQPAPVPDSVKIAARVNLPTDFSAPDRLPAIRFSEIAFHEAVEDSGIKLSEIDPERIGLASAAHIGDLRQFEVEAGLMSKDQQFIPWWQQWLPNSVIGRLGKQFLQDNRHCSFQGPRFCYSTACASSMIALIQSIRSIRRGECDVMVAGGGEGIDQLFAAGFASMRALSRESNPNRACQPFDVNRSGFVMGEGASFLVLERESHALARGAKIYAKVLSEKMASQAHHITSVDIDDEALVYLINQTVRSSELDFDDVDYINAHGTGTEQNDITEITSINSVFRSNADRLHVSSTKSQLGHLVNASGCTELAVSILGLRDGVVPPTVNLFKPESACHFNCVANQPVKQRLKTAMKLSMAFGGHLAGICIQRFDSATNGFAYPASEITA